jgi:cell division topological specificity factor
MFFKFKRRGTAPVARERLKVMLAHERAVIGQSDLVAVLRQEILCVIGRHVTVAPDKVKVSTDRGDTISTLTVDIEIPAPVVVTKAA